MLRTLLKTTAAAAIISSFATSAFAAVDGQNVLDLLAAQLERQGLGIEAGGVSVEGDDNVVLTNIKLDLGSGEPVDIDSFLLQGVSGTSNDGYVVERMALPEIVNSADGVDFAFGGLVVDGFFIAGPDVTDPVLKGAYYRKMTLGPIRVGQSGNTIFSLSGGESTISPYTPGEQLDFAMSFNDMLVDFSTVTDQQVKGTMSALGYEQLKGKITAEGIWDTTSGVTTLDPMTISADDAADFSMRLEIGGYTPALVASLQEMQMTMKGNEQAMGMAMLGLMQQLDIRSASIAIEDKSLTGRVIDFVGSQQGMNRESTIALAKGMLPLGLAQLGNPDFAAKAAAAIGQYLDDPKNITIQAAPPAPVPVAQVMGAAASNPGSLLDILSVKVVANQ